MKAPSIRPFGDILSTEFLRVEHVCADFEGGLSKNYHVVRFLPRVGVLLLARSRVLLVRQWRLLPRAMSWELPGGSVEEGEETKSAAIRECEEETGIRCATLDPLILYYPGLDNVDNPTWIFVCRDFTETGAFTPSRGEIVERCWMGFEEALDMVFRHEITDAMTVVGLTALAARDR